MGWFEWKLSAAWQCAVVVALTGLGVAGCAGGKQGGPRVVSRIGFGSCAHQDQPQPIWDAIAQAEPDLFILLGDNIYGDTEEMEVLRAKYEKFGAVPGYQALRRRVPVLATWDDHDYGANDAGEEYPKREESQRLFLEFFEEPKDSARWGRRGVYDAHIFGRAPKRVQVILLDTRYFRSALKLRDPERSKTQYLPNDDAAATMLGEAQWTWLEEELRKPAEVRIIATSIQAVAEDHVWEKWSNLPRERERLFELIRRTGASGVVFISGDRHRAEICRLDGAADYPLFDITSSALNRPSAADRQDEPNRHRLGPNYIHANFGMIEIDWGRSDPVVRMEIRSVEGEVVLQEEVELSGISMKQVVRAGK